MKKQQKLTDWGPKDTPLPSSSPQYPEVSASLLFLVFLLSLAIKNRYFCQPDGVSITLHESDTVTEETHIYSSLFTVKVHERFTYWRRKSSVCLLLLLCGDIEMCPGPQIPSLTDDINKLCRNRGLKFFHVNVRGLQGNFDELQNILVNSKIDIFALTEIFINVLTATSEFDIPGYTFLYKIRENGIGGGVGIYIRNNIHFIIREDLYDPKIECIWVEITPTKSKSFIFGSMYKPPDSSMHLSKNFTPNLAAKLQNINRENKEAIIMGDININYLKKDDHKVIKDIFAVNGYKQLFGSATRTISSSATLIDVILTNEPSTITNSETVNASLRDHDIKACVRKANNIKYEDETIKCRDFSRYNVDIINNELLNADWKSVYDSNCPVHALRNLMSILVETLN